MFELFVLIKAVECMHLICEQAQTQSVPHSCTPHSTAFMHCIRVRQPTEYSVYAGRYSKAGTESGEFEFWLDLKKEIGIGNYFNTSKWQQIS